jgi:hypothetical protein
MTVLPDGKNTPCNFRATLSWPSPHRILLINAQWTDSSLQILGSGGRRTSLVPRSTTLRKMTTLNAVEGDMNHLRHPGVGLHMGVVIEMN